MENTESASRIVQGIDFSEQPKEISDYHLGEAITRDTFTRFLIDSFAKSRGNTSAQVYYWMWSAQHTGQDIQQILDDFIQQKGLNCLSEEENALVKKYYQQVGEPKHTDIQKMHLEDENSFSTALNEQVYSGLDIWKNPGEVIKVQGQEVKIKPPDKQVLNMNRDEFRNWLPTEGMTTNLYGF